MISSRVIFIVFIASQPRPSPATAPAPVGPVSRKTAACNTAAPAPDRMRITSAHLPRELLRLLRIAAAERADRHGGRPSVSAVIVDVLQRHRDEIQAARPE